MKNISSIGWKFTQTLLVLFCALIHFSAHADEGRASATEAAKPAEKLADLMPIKTGRTSYAYERCFSLAQQALDDAIASCLHSLSPDDAIGRADCDVAAAKEFKIMLARCPADVGRSDVR